MRFLALLGLVALFLADCATQSARAPGSETPGATSLSSVTATPTITVVEKGVEARPVLRPYVLFDGRKYEKRSDPIRADVLRLDRIQPIPGAAEQVVVSDTEIRREKWGTEPTVYAVPGIATRDGLLLRFQPMASPTACSTGVIVFTAEAAEPSPPPFSWRSPVPPPGGALPTPPPTPTNRPRIELSSQGLLAAGWPRIPWEAAIVDYLGKAYRVTRLGYIDFGTADTSISSSLLSPVETLELAYLPVVGLPEVLEPLRLGSMVKDRVVVYRPADRSAAEVITVDPCPKEFRQAEFVYYEAVVDRTAPPSWEAPNTVTAAPAPATTTGVTATLRAVPADGSSGTVRLIAEIVGGPDSNPDLHCLPARWTFGDDEAVIVTDKCQLWSPSIKVERFREQRHTYRAPGVYEATFSLGPLLAHASVEVSR